MRSNPPTSRRSALFLDPNPAQTRRLQAESFIQSSPTTSRRSKRLSSPSSTPSESTGGISVESPQPDSLRTDLWKLIEMSGLQRRTNDNEVEMADFVIKIPPFHYLHVLDSNANTVQVVCGPRTFTCLEHQKVVFGPAKMVIVPPRHFIVIENPIIRNPNPKDLLDVQMDKYGQYKLCHGDQEVRLSQDPFPLFPGEKIVGRIEPLQIVEENTALRLKAKRDFVDRYTKNATTGELGLARRAGDEWLFRGLATYIPQAEVEIVLTVRATILKPNQALKLRAKEDCLDWQGNRRKAGEEWLVKLEGAYLPDVNEILVEVVTATVLEENIALHIRASRSFKDAQGRDRKVGEVWMITREDCELYIPDVNETVAAVRNLTVLNNRQWCIITDPVGEDGVNQLGLRKLVRGPARFFLKPGENLESGVRNVFVLSADEALWVKARESFNDGTRARRPGDKFLVYGPGEYWPPLEVEVLSTQNAFIKIDALNLFYFQPVPFGMAVAAVLVLLFILLRLLSSLGGGSHDEL